MIYAYQKQMIKHKLYIPITIVSMAIFFIAFHSILLRDNENRDSFNEFRHVIHHNLDIALTSDHLNRLELFFPTVSSPPSINLPFFMSQGQTLATIVLTK